jgi:hypothetical protein
MRVLLGRGDWRPSVRIDGLRRYAFIGDSNAYGQGVAPDQTLPAHAESKMNELMPAWPVEAVNFGVGGYNLWNSWLAFKQEPQVYDGVVFTLCANDSEPFALSYGVLYPEPYVTRWDNTHPFSAAVTRCFDDITSFSREQSLPIAVVYYNAQGDRDLVRISEIISDLCASRGLCFIDTLAHYRDRNFTFADLVVSSADSHPSAIAHEAVGRHLAATLKRQGWFRGYEDATINLAPDRIVTAVRAMVDLDRYPTDAALDWALRALDVKSRLAHRMQAADHDSSTDFSAAAAHVTEALTSADRRWHMTNRIRASMGEVAIQGHGIGSYLTCAQRERVKLDELGFILGTGDWNRLAARLLETERPQQINPSEWPSDATRFLDACSLELLRLREALEGLRNLAAPAAVGLPYDESSMLADLEALSRIADRAQAECTALKAAFLCIGSIFNDVRPALSEDDIVRVSDLIGASFKRVKQGFISVPSLRGAIKGMHDGAHASFTTVEVTLSAAVGGKTNCVLSGSVEYSVPNRLPFANVGAFWPDGSPNMVKLYFPIFYAGRLILRTFPPRGIEMLDATLIKIEVHNRPNHRRIVEPASFYRQGNGQFVSPLIYLP